MSLNRVIFAAAAVFAIAGPASARTIEQPVQRDASRDYAVLAGTLKGDTTYRFHFDGRAAETITLAMNAASETVRFRVATADGADVATDTIRFWSGRMNATAPYDIVVYSSRPADQPPAKFALTLTFGEPAMAGTGRIRLAAN